MIRTVLKRGHHLLRTPCIEVVNFEEARPIVDDLWDTLNFIQGIYDFTRGSGIAAPQIGENVRISVVQFNDDRYTLINPKIVNHSDERKTIREGCLSFFEYRGFPLRWTGVTVEACDAAGSEFQLSAEEDFASLLQHEVGHLNGILYDAKILPGSGLTHFPDMPEIP
jgi:peptide deformylase